ncbi:MAG: NAD-dependent epimerase/dehydratase family protein [Actinomycetota bacterium]|nr:NAD-dependent epimerase/dehydratase family protein [Actinomycetota bacterium]
MLITGLSSFWGGRVAQALEADPSVEVIVGLDTTEPTVALERTEFVRSDDNYSILARLMKATQVDTVVHAGLVVDSTRMADRRIHEHNVIGTMNLLAAAAAEASAVTTLVVKASALVYGSSPRDPTWFRETTQRVRAPETRVERSLVEVESYLQAFSEENPRVRVAVLRFANVLGGHLVTPMSQAMAMPLIPQLAGFDPQLQFVEEHDVVRAINFALDHNIAGAYNVAGDGRLPWSEILAIVGKRPLLLPPLFTAAVTGPLGRIGLLDLPPEVLDLLRYGRGIDNRRLKSAGFSYRYTTAGAVERFTEMQRLRRAVGTSEPGYRYQSDVETFFRHSPAIVRSADRVSHARS